MLFFIRGADFLNFPSHLYLIFAACLRHLSVAFSLLWHQTSQARWSTVNASDCAKITICRYIMRDINMKKSPSHSMFYSVNSLIPSLRSNIHLLQFTNVITGGLSIAPTLLKMTSRTLNDEFPGIVPCTLSPIPGFMEWFTVHVSVS